jgi:hypothetical protein
VGRGLNRDRFCADSRISNFTVSVQGGLGPLDCQINILCSDNRCRSFHYLSIEWSYAFVHRVELELCPSEVVVEIEDCQFSVNLFSINSCSDLEILCVDSDQPTKIKVVYHVSTFARSLDSYFSWSILGDKPL